MGGCRAKKQINKTALYHSIDYKQFLNDKRFSTECCSHALSSVPSYLLYESSSDSLRLFQDIRTPSHFDRIYYQYSRHDFFTHCTHLLPTNIPTYAHNCGVQVSVSVLRSILRDKSALRTARNIYATTQKQRRTIHNIHPGIVNVLP
jgi:hypothetical protein